MTETEPPATTLRRNTVNHDDQVNVLDRITRHVADTDADPDTLIQLVDVVTGNTITRDQADDLIQQATHVLLFENGLATWSDFLPHRPTSVPRWLDGKEDETAATYGWLLRDVTKTWPTTAGAAEERVA